MSEETKKLKNCTGRRVALALVLLVLYVLSPLPLYYAVVGPEFDGTDLRDYDTEHFEKVYHTVYAPLWWLCRYVPAVDRFYDWYWKLLTENRWP